MRKESWRKNAVVLTVLVLVGAAVVINWKFSAPAETANGAVSGEESGRRLLGQPTLVSGEGDSSADPAGEDAVYTGSDYFASARLTRQQARDSAIQLLQQAADEEGAAEEAATEASEGIQALAAYTLAEAQIENLVKAKGYADCVAFMGEDSVSVVVSDPDGLDTVDVARIKDIVVSETSYTPDQIKIMEAGATDTGAVADTEDAK